jgi:hypothetical protein
VSLLAPAALGLLSLAVPLIVLYMLRSRRRTLEVPSIRLWEGEEQHVSAALPWQRLKVTAALILQLLALIAFAFVLARPFFRETTVLGPHTVLVVDTSGSMAGAGRFDDAVAQARDLAADASDARLISVIDAGPRPRVLAAFSRDPETVRAAVDQLAAGGGTDDLDGALRLARGLATPDRPTTILLLTDGGAAGAIAEPVSSARHIRFDAVGDDVAITAFGTGVPGETANRVFLEVTNFSRRARSVSVQLLVDGLAVGTVLADIAPEARFRDIVAVDAGPGQVVEALLFGNVDANPLDDSAALVLAATAELSVAVTGEGSAFLDALIDALPGVRVAAGAPPEVVVLDGGDASEIDRPAWLLAPETPPPGVTVTGRVENPIISYQRPAEPILDGLDLGDIAIAEADIVDAFGWLPLVRAGDVPLILLGEVDGNRVVYFTFDVVRSNLPVQVSFPILGARIMDHLGGNRLTTTGTAAAGTPIALTPPPGARAVVTSPRGVVQQVTPGVVEYAATASPGIYRIEYFDGADASVGSQVAVRQFVAAEAAAPSRGIATELDEIGDLDQTSVLREWAPLILAVLLALVLIEWWVAYGKPLPRRRGVIA